MPLACTVCRTPVPPTQAVCPYCRNGFTSRLMCVTCNRVVKAGLDHCQFCDVVIPVSGELVPSYRPEGSGSYVHREVLHDDSLMVPPLLSVPLPLMRPEKYPGSELQSKFGVESEVFHNQRDVGIMNKMSQLVTLLHAIAGEMNGFAGHMESTRRLMKSCRALANDLQEEIEVRRGPQG